MARVYALLAGGRNRFFDLGNFITDSKNSTRRAVFGRFLFQKLSTVGILAVKITARRKAGISAKGRLYWRLQ
jgi:hypothetical protein